MTAYVDALGLVQEFGGVGDADGVPSVAQLLTLAYAADAGVSTAALRRFYWLRVADQRYAQGANTQVTTDVDDLTRSSDHAVTKNWKTSVTGALGDAVARNRILRRGQWGLAVRNGGLDPLTGEALLPGIVTDTSLLALLSETVASPPKTPMVGMIVINRTSLPELRRLARSGELASSLSMEALLSQGFTIADSGRAPVLAEGWEAARTQVTVDWIERELT